MKFKPISTKAVRTYPLKARKSKVHARDFALPFSQGRSFREFLGGLPNLLGAKGLMDAAGAVVRAKKEGRTVAIGMGAHVIKAGLGPVIIDLIERGVIDAVAMNGACVVHDFELAFSGSTSEDVDSELKDGSFGMADETGRILNSAIKRHGKKGLGSSVGRLIENSKYPHKDKSIIAAGFRHGIPVTVHVALGTDILHIHPRMHGAATGEASMRDFRLFSSVVASLEKGVYINIGSAVILPEVFLKALTLARNLGFKAYGFTAVNMDFIQHYRPITNVVKRPTQDSGKGISLTGHHEIMVPLLHAAIVEGLDGRP